MGIGEGVRFLAKGLRLNDGIESMGVSAGCFAGICESGIVDFEGKRSTRVGDSSKAGSVFVLESILFRRPGFDGLFVTVEALGLWGEMNKSDKSLVNFGVRAAGLFGVAGREGVLRASNRFH